MVEMEEKIKIKYHVKELEKLRYIDGKSDWIDLRVAEEVKMKAGEFGTPEGIRNVDFTAQFRL